MHWYRNLTPSCWCGLMRLQLVIGYHWGAAPDLFSETQICVVSVAGLLRGLAQTSNAPAKVRVNNDRYNRPVLCVLALSARPLQLVEHDGIGAIGIVERLRRLLNRLQLAYDCLDTQSTEQEASCIHAEPDADPAAFFHQAGS